MNNFVMAKLKWVCKLMKSLYGLKQSGRMWNLVLHNFLTEKGFIQSPHDPCTYMYNENHNIAIVIVWVDDMVIAGNSEACVEKVKGYLKKKFRMTDLGPISCFLGIRFKQEGGVITMDQTEYLKTKIVKFRMDSSRPRSTPCELGGYYEGENSEPNENISLFREMVGSLIYAMTCTRPDLSFVVSKLSQHVSKPTNADFVMLKHVFRYILGTLDCKLIFKKSQNGLLLSGYCDSDWGSSPDRRSMSGYCFALNPEGPAISWKTKKQETIALSTCEAEYMSGCLASQEAIYLSNLFRDMNICSRRTVSVPVLINIDNQGAMDLARNPVNHKRSKHISIKFHFIREKVANNDIELSYIPSGDNVSDMMTKPVPKVKLIKFRQYLFGY